MDMNMKLNLKQSIWKVLAAILLMLLVIPSSVQLSIVYADTIVISPQRVRMLSIAERYATYRWTATDNNILQYPYTDDVGKVINGWTIPDDLMTNDDLYSEHPLRLIPINTLFGGGLLTPPYCDLQVSVQKPSS
jgi:hypothetical protein